MRAIALAIVIAGMCLGHPPAPFQAGADLFFFLLVIGFITCVVAGQ